MTTAKESIELTRVGPGTQMGAFMRQYWIPAAASSEIQAGAPPIRLMLLGERLVAFRDKAGQVGVMEHRCPHRCASLFFGRTEDDGLRCVYHGWKFDADGNCIEMPNLTDQQNFQEKVRARAYKTAERNGLIWVYMGEAETAPPLPDLEANLMPEDETDIVFIQRECNWLQALEGDIDTSHFGFLHVGSVQPDDVPEDHPIYGAVINRQPDYHVRDMPYGTQYAAHRPYDDGRTYWRFNNFMFPFWTQTPQGPFPTHITARGWVPMDDTHTMYVAMKWMPQKLRAKATAAAPLKNGRPIPGATTQETFLPNTSDWYGRWRLAANASNDYLIDRDAQMRDEIYTGITGIHLQDQAITESMGGIVDHTLERLAPSDQMITRTRRQLLRASRDFAKTGQPPPGVADPGLYRTARCGFFVEDPAMSWTEAYDRHAVTAVRADTLSQAAE